MDSRGQAFSVFKLLIAAVVAGAILLILLQTLQVLPNIGDQDPNSAASNVVKSQVNRPGIQKIIEDVTFENGDSLRSKTIANNSGSLSEEQVCVMVSGSAPNRNNFDSGNSEGRVVLYEGPFSQKVKLFVMCDRYEDLVCDGDCDIGSLESYDTEGRYQIDHDLSSTCDPPSQEKSTYCVVAVISD